MGVHRPDIEPGIRCHGDRCLEATVKPGIAPT